MNGGWLGEGGVTRRCQVHVRRVRRACRRRVSCHSFRSDRSTAKPCGNLRYPPDEHRPQNYILYILPPNAATVVASSVMRSPLRSCYLFLTCWGALCCGQTLIAEWDYTSTSVAATGGANRFSSSSVTCGVTGGCGAVVPDYCGGGTASGYCMCVTAVAWVGPNRPITKRKS